MLTIKLQRVGRKHQPSYRVVVAEKRSKLNGPPVEDLGSYNISQKQVNLKKERIEHWLRSGAQPTPTVHNLLVREGVLNTPKMKIRIRPSKKAPEAPTPEGVGVQAATGEAAAPEAKPEDAPAAATEAPAEKKPDLPADEAGEAKPAEETA